MDEYDKLANAMRGVVHNEVYVLKARMDEIEKTNKELLRQFGYLMSRIQLHKLDLSEDDDE